MRLASQPTRGVGNRIHNWLTVLRGDTRAIFNAASAAARAIDYLAALQHAEAIEDAGQVDRDPDDVDEGTDDTATSETPAATDGDDVTAADAANDTGPADPDAETADTAASGPLLIPRFLRRNR